ncbi:uncharacterized protein LOC143354956 [Halictus rubicundus]|uniref:uncharacterized protein LOC143354956 n=1 Tax=Halictus rubicundus TaxID=77578 RepID=UPI0040363164
MQDERLIECVKGREFLYDTSHAKYMDSKYKSAAWREIAEELNQPAALCKSRWQNIRDQYRKFRARNSAGRSGQATDTLSRKYRYEDLLQFLTPYFQEREMLSSIEYASMGECSSQTTNGPPPSSLSSLSPHNLEIDVDHSDGAEETQPPRKKKKLNLEELGMALEKNITDCTELLKHMVQEKAGVETPRTPIQQFFDAMAASVSGLGRKYQSIAKRKIIEIVTELEEMEDDDNDCMQT